MMKYITCFFFVFTPVSLKEYQLKDGDPKCRYRVHLPTASWHTAHAVCMDSAQELARIGSKADRDFIHVVLGAADQMMAAKPIKNNYSEVWIGAIMRSSTIESLQLNCKPFKLPVNITDPRQTDEIMCIYLNFKDIKFYTDSCTNNKTFICENKSKAKANCTMVSVKKELENKPPYALDQDKGVSNKSDEKSCKEECMQSNTCYGSIWNQTTTHSCIKYRFLEERTTKNDEYLSPSATIVHKSFFVFKKGAYSVSFPQELSELCPEMTPERLQKKVNVLKTNLTVNRKDTAKFRRTLISAPDDRRSAKNLGMVGVVVICLVAGIIVFFDCVNVVHLVACRLRVKID